VFGSSLLHDHGFTSCAVMFSRNMTSGLNKWVATPLGVRGTPRGLGRFGSVLQPMSEMDEPQGNFS
jgi:hypothetical protein